MMTWADVRQRVDALESLAVKPSTTPEEIQAAVAELQAAEMADEDADICREMGLAALLRTTEIMNRDHLR